MAPLVVMRPILLVEVFNKPEGAVRTRHDVVRMLLDVGIAYSVNVPQIVASKVSAMLALVAEPPPLPGVTVGVSVIEALAVGIPGRVSLNILGAAVVGVVTASCVESLEVSEGVGAPGPRM